MTEKLSTAEMQALLEVLELRGNFDNVEFADLRADNARLREALKQVTEAIDRENLRASMANSSLSETERECGAIARAALAATEEK